MFDHLTDTHKHPVRGNNRLLVPSFFPTSPPVLPLTPRNQTRTKAPLPCEVILHFLVPQGLPQTSQVSQDDCATENGQTEAPRMGQTPIPQSPLKTQQRTGALCGNFRKQFVRCNVFAIQTKPSFSSIFTFDLRPSLSSSPVARSHSVPPSCLPSFLLLPFPLPACLLRNLPFPALLS